MKNDKKTTQNGSKETHFEQQELQWLRKHVERQRKVAQQRNAAYNGKQM
jgi:hypothetical protein